MLGQSQLKEKKDRMFNIEGFKKYRNNFSWLAAENLLRMAVALLVGAWVARYLGPEDYGTLSYVGSFVGLFVSISYLGIDSVVVKALVENAEGRDKIMGTAFVLKYAGTLLFITTVFIITRFTSNTASTNQLIYIWALAGILLPFNVIDFFFQSQVLSKYMVTAQLATMIFSSICRLLLIYFKMPLIYFVSMSVFESIFLTLGIIYMYYKKNLKLSAWRFDKKLALEMLAGGIPLLFSGIAITIYLRIDQVMIKEMMDAKAVGNYAVAVRLSEVWYFIPISICSTLFPAIIKAKAINEEVYNERFQKLYDAMVWGAVAIAIPAVLLADDIIWILFGTEFSEASSVLKIYIWAGVFVFLGVAVGRWFIAENLQKYTLIRSVAGAGINVVLNYFWIPRYGIKGAAFATIVAYASQAYISLIFFKHSRKNFWRVTSSFNIFQVIKRWT